MLPVSGDFELDYSKCRCSVALKRPHESGDCGTPSKVALTWTGNDHFLHSGG